MATNLAMTCCHCKALGALPLEASSPEGQFMRFCSALEWAADTIISSPDRAYGQCSAAWLATSLEVLGVGVVPSTRFVCT